MDNGVVRLRPRICVGLIFMTCEGCILRNRLGCNLKACTGPTLTNGLTLQSRSDCIVTAGALCMLLKN